VQWEAFYLFNQGPTGSLDKTAGRLAAFSGAALQEFIPLIHSTVGEFTQRMDEFCAKREYFDALPWFNYLAFDILSDLAFGERIGMLKQVLLILSQTDMGSQIS
jgi:hypothetical protein